MLNFQTRKVQSESREIGVHSIEVSGDGGECPQRAFQRVVKLKDISTGAGRTMSPTKKMMKLRAAMNIVTRIARQVLTKPMKRAGQRKRNYSKGQVAGSNPGPSTSEICAPEESPSSTEIFEHLDTMLKSDADWPDTCLPELIEDIDRVLSREKENSESAKLNRKQKAPGGVTKETELGDKIKSVCKKIFKVCKNNNEVAVEVLKTIGEFHWAATGFVLVASVLKRLHAVKRNRKERLMLLKSMNDLAKIVMELRPLPYKTATTKTTIKESIYTILKGAISCSKMMHRGIANRMAHTEKDREELLDVRREIEELRSTLHLEITVCIFKWQCDFRKEWQGRKRSVTDAELENEEGSNKRSCISNDRDLNEFSNPTQSLRKNSRISDFYRARKHEDTVFNESSNPTQVLRTTEDQGKMVSQEETELKNVKKRRLDKRSP